MESRTRLRTIVDAAREIGVCRNNVAVACQVLGIRPQAWPGRPNAKGLTPDEFERVRKALRPERALSA